MDDNALDDFIIEDTEITDKNLFIKIWTKPTKTLTYILDKCPTKHVTLLLILAGITNSIDNAISRGTGDSMSITTVLISAVIIGGLFGWLGYYIYAWALSATGRWLKGKAINAEFRTIIAWSSVPAICSLVLLIPQLLLYGDELFKSEPMLDTEILYYTMIGFGIIEFCIAIWSIVIMVKGIMIVQDFGIGKSILNMFLPGLILIIPILLIVFLVMGLR